MADMENQEFYEVAKDLRCPTCTGLSVLDSDAGFSVQIKDQVRAQLEQGKHKQEILQYFTERYGPWILREPPKEGFNALAWYLPIALLIIGPISVWLAVWRRRSDSGSVLMRSQEEIVREMDGALKALRVEAPE